MGIPSTCLQESAIITAPLRPVDISPAMELFAGEIPYLECIRRPVGEVDLLIGIQNARLFPVVMNLESHRVGNMRVLYSDFGTVMLLDGVHPTFGPSELYQTQEAFKRSHAIFSGSKFEKNPRDI